MNEERIREILQGEQSRPKVKYGSPSRFTSDEVIEFCEIALTRVVAWKDIEQNKRLNRVLLKMALQIFDEKQHDMVSVVKGLEMALDVLPKYGKYHRILKTLIEDVKSGKMIC